MVEFPPSRCGWPIRGREPIRTHFGGAIHQQRLACHGMPWTDEHGFSSLQNPWFLGT